MNYAQQLAAFSVILEQKGYFTAFEGNASMYDPQSGLTYVTPSGRMKLLLSEKDICVVDRDGNQVGGAGKRTSEYFLHEAIYRGCPDMRAVVHSHCPYLTAYALRYEDFVGPERCFLSEIFPRAVCLPWGRHGTHELHQGIEQALQVSPVCLLGGHGVVCASQSMESCIGMLEAAEGFAKTLYLARTMQ